MRSESKQPVTVVLDVRPMLRGSENAVVEARLLRRPGVLEVEARAKRLVWCQHIRGSDQPGSSY